MKKDLFIAHLTTIGNFLKTVSNNSMVLEASVFKISDVEEFEMAISLAKIKNQWFTDENVRKALNSWAGQLNEHQLTEWLKDVKQVEVPQVVAIIMAGNIPLVGFHDLISVLASGNRVLVKPSSDDEVLIAAMVKLFIKIDPIYAQLIEIVDGRMTGFDKVIATGSDNTARYFHHYFGKYPNIIRKNRTSLAIISGNESKDELVQLGKDIFTFFGMGCRNVSHLLVPAGYTFDKFFEAMFVYGDILNHNKYVNNYEYHKAIFLLELMPFLDNNFLMIRENAELASPLSVIHYSFYQSPEDITNYILDHHDKIQCIVGKDHLPFGSAQTPNLWDYADGVNTIEFLTAKV